MVLHIRMEHHAADGNPPAWMTWQVFGNTLFDEREIREFP